MLHVLRQVGTLMLSFGILLLATGTFNTFIAVRSSLEGFPPTFTGLMMSGFYGGGIVAAMYSAQLINRIGHIRAFAAFGSLSAVVVLLHPFMVTPWAWIGLRAFLGFAVSGLYMCTESWLNERATPETRGTILSLHAMVAFLGMGGGQLMINAGSPVGPDLFMIAALLFALGIIPIVLTRQIHPEPLSTGGFGIVQLYEVSPSGVAACVAGGLCSGSLLAVGPVFGQELGLSTAQLSQLMTAFVMSGLLFQLPFGWLSDLFDRRSVMAMAGAVVFLAAGVLLWLVKVSLGEDGYDWDGYGLYTLLAAVLFGGVIATFYPLGIAYANDYLEPEQRVQAAGGLVLSFAVGALAGSALSAGSVEILGPMGLLLFNGLVVLVLIAFVLYRRRRRSWAGIAEKESFQAVPEAIGTPGGWEFDPRWEDESEEQYDLRDVEREESGDR
ncbi:MAG TPA: MFS transporter [Arenicellales bacterium]|nr:MFS transporter [Arenicellales bacterium]